MISKEKRIQAIGTYRNYDWLYDQYVTKKQSLKDVGMICGISPAGVLKWMKRLRVERRSISEGNYLRSKKDSNHLPYRRKNWLQEKYIKEQRSTMNIAQLCGVRHSQILYWLERHGIERRTTGEGVHLATGHHFEAFTSELHQFLDGSLLGDGGLTHSRNPSAVYKQKSKFKNYAAWVRNEFARWNVDLSAPKLVTNTDDGVRNCLFSMTYSVCSKSYSDLKDEYERWYPEGIKIVPCDLQFSPELVLKWYCDDGSYDPPCRVILCTNCFSKSDVLFLKERFENIGIPSVLYESKKGSNQWLIAINKPGHDAFFDYIGHQAPIPEMAHKFPNI